MSWIPSLLGLKQAHGAVLGAKSVVFGVIGTGGVVYRWWESVWRRDDVRRVHRCRWGPGFWVADAEPAGRLKGCGGPGGRWWGQRASRSRKKQASQGLPA